MKLLNFLFSCSIAWGLVTLCCASKGSLDTELDDDKSSCCSQGEAQGRLLSHSDSCSSISLPPSSVPPPLQSLCQLYMESCCDDYLQKRDECDSGFNVALMVNSCDTLNGTENTCCQSCILGLANRSSETACEEMALTVIGNTTDDLLLGDAFRRCCVMDRCLLSNPCQHYCEDHGGVEVTCACRPGYQLIGYGCQAINLEPTAFDSAPDTQEPLGPGSKDDEEEPGVLSSSNVKDSSGILLAVHSQTEEIPDCFGFRKLWDGYSLFSEDLGTPGSCLRQFTTMPFHTCDVYDTGCRDYSRRNYDSYWLATGQPNIEDSVEGNEIKDYVSRCAVCEVPKNVIAVHSQTAEAPDCPPRWVVLWEGYSFVTYDRDAPSTVNSLSSPGSCLQDFHINPVIACSGASADCRHPRDRVSAWLAVADNDVSSWSQMQGTGRKKVSRCAVCIRN